MGRKVEEARETRDLKAPNIYRDYDRRVTEREYEGYDDEESD
jgi:hypothetical protein